MKQDASLHAVYESDTNTYGAFSWSTEPQQSADLDSAGEFAVMMQQKGDEVHVWLSQPSRTDEPVMRFNQLGAGELLSDEDKRVQLLDGYWVVNTKGLDGKAYPFIFRNEQY